MENIALHHQSQMASNWKVHYEEFMEDVPNVAGMETVGWADTDVGTPAGGDSILCTPETGYLLINCGTTADTGHNIQRNLAPTAARVPSKHNIMGPITSSATLMDSRELVWACRIGRAHTVAAWNNKMMFGWFVTDTGLMVAATGAEAVATGMGIGFHVGEDGNVMSFCGKTTAAVETDTGVDMGTPASATVLGNWTGFGFHAKWIDASASTGSIRFYINSADTENGWVLVDTQVGLMPMVSTEVYSSTFEVINGPATAQDLDIAVDYIFSAISRPGK